MKTATLLSVGLGLLAGWFCPHLVLTSSWRFGFLLDDILSDAPGETGHS
jgi:hypothetical protein